MKNIDITQLKTKLLALLVGSRIILMWLIVLGLLGFTLWRIQFISDLQANQSDIDAAMLEEENQVVNIRFDDELRTRIEQLEERPVDVEPRNLGTDDPFNP